VRLDGREKQVAGKGGGFWGKGSQGQGGCTTRGDLGGAKEDAGLGRGKRHGTRTRKS